MSVSNFLTKTGKSGLKGTGKGLTYGTRKIVSNIPNVAVAGSLLAATLAPEYINNRTIQEFDSITDLVSDQRASLLDESSLNFLETPYTLTEEGVSENWFNARKDVLTNSRNCIGQSHYLVNFNGNVVGVFDNIINDDGYTNKRETDDKIQNIRHSLENRDISPDNTTGFVIGEGRNIGYPFAYSCEGSSASTKRGIQRYFGTTGKLEDRLWGEWKDVISIPKDNRISMEEAFQLVKDKLHPNLPDFIYNSALGQYVIESGGKKHAKSSAGASGVLQIMQSTLELCGIPKSYANHRFAQIDCAFTQLEKIYYDFMVPQVNDAFPNIPEDKKDLMAQWLTTQSYFTGQGNISNILADKNDLGVIDEMNENYRSKYSNFSGEDLAMHLIINNFGHFGIGAHSVKYVTDTRVAYEAILNSAITGNIN